MKAQERDDLLATLEERFGKNSSRHKGIAWEKVAERLKSRPAKLKALLAMEESGGEPDVVAHIKSSGEYVFHDCSAESPSGRRSLCFDDAALQARKKNKPDGSAVAMAKSMGIELLTEDEYRELQKLGEFDLKTSSWVQTTDEVRKLGGAMFCDRRYDRVWLYHNGADSYYAARGFRGSLRV